jgi:hypothetical protein
MKAVRTALTAPYWLLYTDSSQVQFLLSFTIKAGVQVFDRPGRREAGVGNETTLRKNYDALVKLALFCANQARTGTMKHAAREAWRLAVEYRDQAATLGEPPDIGKKRPHADEA